MNRGRLRTLLLVAGFAFGTPTVVTVVAGTVLMLVAAAFHVWARGSLRVNFELSTSGPYRWVRNPFYLATALLEAGLCVAIGNPWLGAAYAIAWAVVYGETVRREERHLATLFGPAFDDYRRRVPAIVPWRRPVKDLSPSRPFSWLNPSVCAGREFARLARAFAAPPAIYAFRTLLADPSRATSGDHPGALVAAAAAVALVVLDRALLVRMKSGRPVVPLWAHGAWVRLTAAAVFAGSMLLVRDFEVESDLVILPTGAALAFLVVLGLRFIPRRERGEQVVAYALEGLGWLAGGVLCEVPWLGIAAFAFCGVLAVDAFGRDDEIRARSGALLFDARPRVRISGLVAVLALLAVLKEL